MQALQVSGQSSPTRRPRRPRSPWTDWTRGNPRAAARIPSLSAGVRATEPKDIVFELEKLSGATSETTVELALNVLNGDYNVQVGLPDRPNDVVACGDIPQEVAES